jgi:hypothetical protein
MVLRSKEFWFQFWFLAIIVAVPFLAILLLSALVYNESGITPRQETTTHMYIIRTRVFTYIKASGTWPESLAQLPEVDGKGNVNKDGWGADIIYLVNSNGDVTLKSFGGASRPGAGSGNREIVESFATKDANGNWRKGIGADY